MMKSIFLKTNVTSVKFLGSYLFAGIGSVLHVYKNETEWKIICRLKIFSSQNIYGIISKGDEVILYGGHELVVVKCNLITHEFRWEKNYSFVDWILDSTWLDYEPHIAILTANNTLYKFNLSSGLSMDKIKGQDVCILYSGKILNSVWQELVILAGTVYQEIIIWHFSPEMNMSHTLHRLKGHKGVIFSINYDSNSKLISSTSDDRTLRIWKVECISNERTVNWKECIISLKISIFCHQARVWRSQIVSENKIISIGEDSMISIWNESGHCVNQWHGHQGSAIWSVDFSDELGLIATGGGDGGINIWPLSESIEPFVIYTSSSSDEYTIPRSVILTHGGGIVLITNQGVFKYYLNDQWHTFGEDKRFASYCILQASPNKRNLALAGINGDILLFKVDVNIVITLDAHIIEGRVFSLIWLTDTIFITCGNEGSLILWELMSEIEVPYLRQISKHTLPTSKERWITSALLFNGEYLLCGDRCGSIHLYELPSTNMVPIDSTRKLHGYKGVTSIKLISGKIISTGRDGTYRQLSIIDRKIRTIDCNKLQMEWIAKIEETSIFGAIVIGFHDTHLILWSCKEGRPLFKMDCGGGHRSWDCSLDETGNYLSVTFIKDKCVYKYYRLLKMICHRTIETGGHSKSINSACHLNSHQCNDRFILTGGEDNTLRLSRWNNESFIPQVTFHRHISSIRAIYAIEDGESHLVASCGGRGQLIMWRLAPCQDTLRVTEVASHMVRPSDKNNTNSKQALPLPDAEIRYMDVNIVHLTVNDFLILAGCSDGLFRVLGFNSQSNEIVIRKILDDCNEHCILKVANFIWNDNIVAMTMATDGNLSFWNVSSLLKETETSSSVKPKSYKLHSLGINSYSFILQQDSLILATGGDDSTLSISVFTLMKNNDHLLLTSWIENNLHSCQINGIQILNDLIITVALDQRISLLKWNLSNAILTVNFVRQELTSIPDTHGLMAWSNQENIISILIYGLGIEIFNAIIDEIT